MEIADQAWLWIVANPIERAAICAETGALIVGALAWWRSRRAMKQRHDRLCEALAEPDPDKRAAILGYARPEPLNIQIALPDDDKEAGGQS